MLFVFFYNIFLLVYSFAVRVFSLWNPKARNWIIGRKDIYQKIRSTIGSQSRDRNFKLVWIHCSSLGEFEQGKPVLEGIKERLAMNGRSSVKYRFLVTFFSPSGYEIKKDYPGADYIFYLPMDSRSNARRFIDLVDPSLVIFIKYDYWYYYLTEIKKKKIQCLLISAVFRRNQAFFKWYGVLQRKMLRCFSQIFVQDQESKNLLGKIDISFCSVSGDTRFDTVMKIAGSFEPIPSIENFVQNKKCLVAGSTWKEDELMLAKVFSRLNGVDLKLIIAPHEVHSSHIEELIKLFKGSVRFSQISQHKILEESRCLIIDNIGMLSRLYKYGYVAYVGGGFTRDGVHNVLEAAVYSKPVIFGKNYKKYREALELVANGGAISFLNDEELDQILRSLLADADKHRRASESSGDYVWKNRGATEKILDYIEEKRLLTS